RERPTVLLPAARSKLEASIAEQRERWVGVGVPGIAARAASRLDARPSGAALVPGVSGVPRIAGAAGAAVRGSALATIRVGSASVAFVAASAGGGSFAAIAFGVAAAHREVGLSGITVRTPHAPHGGAAALRAPPLPSPPSPPFAVPPAELLPPLPPDFPP